MTGRDGSPRFLGGTRSCNGSGTGREIGREHSREVGREHCRESVGKIVGKTVRKTVGKSVRKHSRDIAGRCSPELLGTLSGTNAGWRQRLKRGKRYRLLFDKNTLTTSAVSSTNLGLILIFASCYNKVRGCYRHRPPFAGFSTRQIPCWSL